MVLAKEAVEKGMADRVESFDATLGLVIMKSRGGGKGGSSGTNRHGHGNASRPGGS